MEEKFMQCNIKKVLKTMETKEQTKEDMLIENERQELKTIKETQEEAFQRFSTNLNLYAKNTDIRF